MYNSGITAREFINTVKEESDITISIPESSWYRWITTVEQLLYTEIFKEHDVISIGIYTNNFVEYTLSSSPIDNECDPLTFDDIVTVFFDDIELERSGETGAMQFPERPLYYTKYDGKLYAQCPVYAENMIIVYRKRPRVKNTSSGDVHIMVPVEWLDIVGAKMRGEAYKIANEDGLSAKWLNDFNMQLESLKIWAAKRNERYGR